MKNPKYKVSPRGKRKLDYPQKKSRSSVKLPLIGKTIYLDVKENKHLKQLQCDLKRLGATLEEFVSRDINYLITAQPRPRNKGQSCYGDESPAASPFNCEPSPSPLNVEDKKVASVTRGKALAEKARITRKTNTLLDNAEQWGVKIVSLEGAFKWIDKELKKLPKVSSNLSKNKPKCVSSYKTLKSPFVKIEAESYCYRPFHIELEVWPRLNVDTPRGSCPFDGTLIKGGEESREERGDLLAAQVDIPSEDLQKNIDEPANSAANSGKPPTDKSCKKSETEAVVGSHILTAGELKRRKELKRKQERKRGYCECCHIKYEDLDKHVKEEQHILYVKNKSNYEKLDSLIYTGPSSQHFLAEYMKKSALQTVKRENKSDKSKSPSKPFSPRKSPRKTVSEHAVHPSYKSPRKSTPVNVGPSNLKSPRKNQYKDNGNSLSKTSESVDQTRKKETERMRKRNEDDDKIQENIQPKTSCEQKDRTDASRSKVGVLKNLDNNTSVTVATVTVENNEIINQDFLSSPRKMRDRKSLNKAAASPLKNEITKTTPRSLVKCSPVSDKECLNKDIKGIISDKTVKDDSNKENIEPGKYIEDVKPSTNLCDQFPNKTVENCKNVSELNQGKHNKKKCASPVVGAECESNDSNIKVGDNVGKEVTDTVHNSDIEKCFYKIVKLGKERTCREASSDDFEVCFARFSQHEELPASSFRSSVNKINKSFDNMIEHSEWQKNDIVQSPSKRKSSRMSRVVLLEQNVACEDVNETNVHQNSEKSGASVHEASYNNKVVTDNEKSEEKVFCGTKHEIYEKIDVSKKRESDKKNVKTDRNRKRSLSSQRNYHKQNEATNEEEVNNDVFVFEDLYDQNEVSVTYTKTLAERIKERAMGRRTSVKSYNLNEIFSPKSDLSNDSIKCNKIDRGKRKSPVSKKMSGSSIASAKVLNKYRNQRHGNSGSTGDILKGYQGDDEGERTPGSYKSRINSKSKQKKQKTKFWHYVEEKPKIESKEQFKDLPNELRLLKDGLDMDMSVVKRRTLLRHSQIDNDDTSITSGSETVMKEKLDVKRKVKKFWHDEPVVESNDSDQNEAFKDLPKELRVLKESLNGFQSDSVVGKRQSRTCANRSSIIASDSEKYWKKVGKEIAVNNKTNLPRCSLKVIKKDQSGSTYVKKKSNSHHKRFFHYVPIPDSDIVKDNENDKNLPRELRYLTKSMVSLNGEVDSRRHSRTCVSSKRDQDVSTDCEQNVPLDNVRTILNKDDVISNKSNYVNKTGLSATHKKSLNRTRKKGREICPSPKINEVNDDDIDGDQDNQKMVRMLHRRQTANEATYGYEIRKKDPNISYKEVDTDTELNADDIDGYQDSQKMGRMCHRRQTTTKVTDGCEIRKKDPNISYKKEDTDTELNAGDKDGYQDTSSRKLGRMCRRRQTTTKATDCYEIRKKDPNISYKEVDTDHSDDFSDEKYTDDTKHSVDFNDKTKANGYTNKKEKPTDASGKDNRFWMFVAEVDGDSDDESEFDNIPKELRDLKLWKMKSGSTSRSRSRSRGKIMDDDKREVGLLEENIDKVVGAEQTCSSVAENISVTDSRIDKNISDCEKEKTKLETKSSRSKSKKRKVFWEYEPVIDNDDEENKHLQKHLPNELRNLVDSWNNVCGDNLRRSRQVSSRDSSNARKNKNKQINLSLGDSEDNELFVCKNNKSVSEDVLRLDERSKSPVFNRHQKSTNETCEKRGSPVFKKSPKSNFHNSKKEKSDKDNKHNSDNQSDFCPDSDNDFSDTIDEIQDCSVKSHKYKEMEQAGSGYSRISREKRRKKWKRKMKETECIHAESLSNSKRRKIDDQLDNSEYKLKSPRRQLLTHGNNQRNESINESDSFVESFDLPEVKQSSLIWKPAEMKNLDTIQNQSWSMSNEKLNNDVESDADFEKRTKRNNAKGLCLKNDKKAASSKDISKQGRTEVSEDDSDGIEENYEQYVPVYISSPSRNSNSSWIETIDEYLDNSLKNKPDSSFKGPNSSLYFSFNRSPLKSPVKRVGTSPYKASLLNSASKLKSPSKTCLRSPDKVHRRSTIQSPSVEKVDDDIEFNFSSPQKNCTEYSYLKTVQGVVRDLSSPVSFNFNTHSNHKSSTPNNRKSISKKLSDRLDSKV